MGPVPMHRRSSSLRGSGMVFRVSRETTPAYRAATAAFFPIDASRGRHEPATDPLPARSRPAPPPRRAVAASDDLFLKWGNAHW
ncbi:hypothetical protein SLI_4041 [Streptomyces lividans 1326]|uniref:Uncharacterized protein n=1 Tax=Streptomyces lividans 1326 TaxID=1200984 RepID=A0A7U9DTB4_STRLI|nr:hypothetical protein SLI_4041 [Streptomyces lividans 1326]